MRFLQSLLRLLTTPARAARALLTTPLRAARTLPSAVRRTLAPALSRALASVGGAVSTLGRGVLALLPGEWKKPIAALFVTGLALVPLIYSGNMTWSFLDPSNNLDQVTAAVVNEDEGATATSPSGERTDLDIGADFTDTLLETDKENVYRFVEVSAAEAERGLADGTYGARIEIPADFSRDVASLGGDAEQAAPALLTITTDDTVNYVGGNFTKSVGTALTDSLRANVLEEYLGKIYVGFTTIHDGLVDASDGSGQLADGSAELHEGTGDLVDGTEQLTDGTGRLADGSRQLATGADTLHQGSLDLVVGLDQLASGAVTLRDGTAALDSGAQELSGGLVTLDENGRPLVDGAEELAAGTSQIATGAGDLATGAGQVAEGTQQLDQTITAAQQRAEELGVTEEGVQRTSEDLVTAIDALEQDAAALPERLQDPAASAGTLAETASGLDETTSSLEQASQDLATATTDRTEDARTLRDGATTISEDVTALDEEVQGAAEDAGSAAESATTAEESTRSFTEQVDDLAARCADSGADPAFCEELATTSDSSEQVREDAAQAAADAGTADETTSAAAESSTDIADTAGGMTESADSLVTYLEDLSGTTSTLAEDSTAVADAVGPLAEDATTLDQDLATLREEAVAAAPSAEPGQSASDLAGDLADQARTAAAALPEAYSTLQQGAEDVHRLNSGAQQVSTGASDLADATGTAHTGAEQLASGVTQYTDGVGQARTGAQRLAAGTGQVADGAAQLADGAREARSGAQRLADGSGDLATGAHDLAGGAAQVDEGAGELADGATRLDDGAGELADGADELHDGLAEAEGEVPSYTDAESDQLSAVAADPVQMSFQRAHGLGRFGEGLAPLFLAISLWVGGMAIFLMMPPFSAEAARRGVGAVRLLAGGLVPALLLGLVQTAIAVGALHYLVGVTMQDLPLMLALAGLTSAVFVALNHGFGAMFGPVGKFVALVLIALQISGAGGTYPTKTLPEFFQVIHPYLPMTHAVDAFRGAIGGGWIDPTGDLIWLSGWLLLGLALGLAGALVQLRRAAAEEAGAVLA